jgi:hypothetical protein
MYLEYKVFMKVITGLWGLFILCSIGGCTVCSTKQIPCGPFEDTVFFKWFSYQPGSAGQFKNTVTNDTLGFVAVYFDTSKAYEITVGGYGRSSERSCDASANISAVFYNSSARYFDIHYNAFYYANDSDKKNSLGIYFGTNYWYAGAITEETIAADSFNNKTAVTHYENILFENGITYNRLITLTTDTVFKKENDMVYKLFVAKGHGIVGFETYPSKQKWVIQ